MAADLHLKEKIEALLRQEMLWGILEASDLSEAEKNTISLLVSYSPEELK